MSTDPIAAALDRLQEYAAGHPEHDTPEIVQRARAALAEPADGPAAVAGQPTDAEILKVWCQGWDTSEAWGAIKFARAVLARSATSPAPPPEGEVAELVAELRSLADSLANMHISTVAATVARAAELLQRQAAPVPVPVAERLPGPEDCTAQGWCWVFYRGFAAWTLEPPLGQDGRHTGYTHWLPAHALPLPAQAGEVQP